MRRITAHAAVAAVVGGLLIPVAATATATSASADTQGVRTVVAGGGRGLSGPASRARISDSNARMDAAPDGSVLVTDGSQVLRVRPDSDTVTVVPGTTVPSSDQPVHDVAAAGSAVVFTTASGVQRASSDGSTTQLLARDDVRAIDVGADGVIWVATQHDVLRILPSGAVLPVTTAASHVGDALDLTVAPDGSRAYVLDDGFGRFGVYQVTAAGVGARVAGNLSSDNGATPAQSPLADSTSEVRSISTDGTTMVMSLPGRATTKRFPIGGSYAYTVFPGCNDGVAYRGAHVVTLCRSTNNAAPYPSIHEFTVDGGDFGRILGQDPAQPWSPDGVLAADAYLDGVRGAAGLPDGRIVFTTEHGLVREVGTDGRLHTRASLGWTGGGGKTAVGPDGTAYVVTDAGGVVTVPVGGAPVPLTLDADATDVEVETDGTVVVADAGGHRLLRLPADGSGATVLTDALGTPMDIGLDGDTVLVADTGLRRVAPDGTVTSVLTGGAPTTAARTSDGIWTDPLLVGQQHRPEVLLPSGALAPVRAQVPWWTATQVQAVGNGDVVFAGSTSVWLVSDAGLPAVAPFSITATAMPGRIDLAWDPTGVLDVLVVAKRGAIPPADRWDGVALGNTHSVRQIGDDLMPAGEQWSFAAFAHTAADTWSAAATATASALEDTAAPMPPENPVATATATAIALTWTSPPDPDIDHAVVRMALGTTPPATPDDGTLVSSPAYSGVFLPQPVAGQDYALSIFDVDLHGNYSRSTTVVRLDRTPPAPVTDLQVAPDYRAAVVSFAPPPDADYDRVDYALAPGNDVPSHQNTVQATGSPVALRGLTMGTDYTLAVWSVDGSGNLSEPAVTHFTTQLDAQPPGAVTGLSATGGNYQVAATWTPPAATDVDTLTARLTDDGTGADSSISLAKAASGYTWSGLPGGHSYTVTVTVTDTQGLMSDVATATAQTSPDSNGAPPLIAASAVSVTPLSTTAVRVSFPRPAIPDLKTVQAAVAPIGQDPGNHTAANGLVIGATTVTGSISLPQAGTSYQLILLLTDLNGHVTLSVGPNVAGAPSATQLPAAPGAATLTSPADNTVGISWSAAPLDALRVTSWTVTAVSGSLTRSLTLSPWSRQAGFDDLDGRRDWTVSVTANNAFGAGPTATVGPVPVTDDSAPAPVTGATRTPAADAELLSWANPTAFDFDHVVVTRLGATAAETQVVYRGSGTSVRAAGLLAGRAYTFEIRAFDHLGNVAGDPVTLSTIESALTLDGPAAVAYGRSGTFTGTLSWNGTHPGGRTVGIQAQPYGSTVWTTVAVATTSSNGTFAAQVKPTLNTHYRAGYGGSGDAGGAYSAVRMLTVAPAVSMQSNRTSVGLGGTVTFSTTVAPRHPGGSVLLQRWTGSFWSTVAVRALSSVSTASATVRPPARGINTYRWVTPADPAHAVAAGPSRQVRVY